ncbi:MAG: HAMP domain-containing methyl-accepting chemotaxis protein [Pseudomonadota bacterium]
MLENWSISKRIYAGFGAMMLILLAVSIFGFVAVSTLGRTFEDYRQTARQTLLINDYIEDVFEARLASLRYRFSPGAGDVSEVRSNIAEVTQDNRLDALFADDPGSKAELSDLKDQASAYAEAFGRVVDLQNQRDVLVAQISELGPATRLMLDEIMTTAYADGDIEAAFYAGVAMRELMLARYYMESFLRENSPDAMMRVDQHLTSSAEQMSILLQNLSNPRRRELAGEVVTNKDIYLQAASELETILLQRNTILRTELDQIGPDLQNRYEAIVEAAVARQDTLGPEGQAIVDNMTWIKPTISTVASLLALLLAHFIGRAITGTVRSLANRTEKLANGDLTIDITGTELNHEIGQMARALEVFRDGERERRDQSARETKRTEETAKIVSQLSGALGQLAKGDLTVRVPEDQSEDFRIICTNFNGSVAQLQSIMSNVVRSTGEIANGMQSLASGSEQLATRTERQASALAETTATITQIGGEIDDTARKSKETQELVQVAGSKAESGREVVMKSVAAMDKIKNGSEEIAKITSVIDDLAFQTNLLALNAGVEAARAGEEGRGFAVVAAEVRVLAQHASEAAQQISQQITSSVAEVAEGVNLADQARQALSEIAEMVGTVRGAVVEISETAQGQATGIKEINIAMSELDNLTQQNAAMVEETTAATVDLRNEVGSMQANASILRIEEGDRAYPASSADLRVSGDSVNAGPRWQLAG